MSRLRIATFEGLNFGADPAPQMSQAAKDTWNALMSQGFSWDVVNGTVQWTPSLPMMIRADLRAEIEAAILAGYGLAGDDLIVAKVKGGKLTTIDPVDISGKVAGGAFALIAVGVGLLFLLGGKKKGGRVRSFRRARTLRRTS